MILGEETKPSLENLVHFGVKGMKWGVRKEEQSTSPGTSDHVVKKGTEIHNISGDAPRDISGHVYASYLKKDNANYRGSYSQMLKYFMGAKKTYDNVFEAKQDIKLPSEKKAVDTFKKLYDSDRENISRAMAKAKVDSTFILALGRKMGIKVEDKQFQKYRNLGKKALAQKGFMDFQQSLAISDYNRSKYFGSLLKQGYTGMIDSNDVKQWGSDRPLIIFKGDKSLKRKATIELSERDIDQALKEYKELSKERG